MAEAPTVTLNDGLSVPLIGFGTWQIANDAAPRTVADALADGYRLIDTASVYANEEGVGEALRRTDVPRAEIVVTSKVWNADQGYDTTLKAFDASLARLGLDRLDLYLIHWPAPSRGLFVETWRALVRLREEGRVRSIGVSNFRVADLTRIVDETGVVPSLNQIECHPRLQQNTLREFHAACGIATEAWSPLGRGALLAEPSLKEVAARRGCTPAQAVLRWLMDEGAIVIPRSSNRDRIRENLASTALRLEPEDAAAIEGLETGERVGPDPDVFA